jgi:predicted RNA binding protein YcfA (HicA-like mRNA interferase family)
VKRRELIKTIEAFGCVLIRHGGKHDWYRNPQTGISQPVPRHAETKEYLAKRIIKMPANPEQKGNGQ